MIVHSSVCVHVHVFQVFPPMCLYQFPVVSSHYTQVQVCTQLRYVPKNFPEFVSADQSHDTS